MAANPVRNAILRKKINGAIHDLMTKTTVDMVLYDTETLRTYLVGLKAIVNRNRSNLDSLLGDSEEGGPSITEQITSAIDTALQSVDNGDDEWGIGNRIKVLEELGQTLTQNLDTAKTELKAYTDDKLGFDEDDGFTTVKKWVSDVETSLKAEIAAVFKFKGKVDNLTDIESQYYYGSPYGEEPELGDVWQVKYGDGKFDDEGTDNFEKNAEYAWDGKNWVELGSMIDLSGYYRKSEIDAKVNTINDKIEETGGAAQKYADKKIYELWNKDVEDGPTGIIVDALKKVENDAEAKRTELDNKLSSTKGKFIANSDPETAKTMTENDLWAFILNDGDDAATDVSQSDTELEPESEPEDHSDQDGNE